MNLKKHSHHKPITGEGWREFSSICINLSSLDIGPHAKALLGEMIIAVKSGMPIVVIILAATIVDIVMNEEQPDLLNDEDNSYHNGLDWLNAKERRQLNWLRGLRNKLVHYQGVITGMGGSNVDHEYLSKEADKALSALSPLLAGFERF